MSSRQSSTSASVSEMEGVDHSTPKATGSRSTEATKDVVIEAEKKKDDRWKRKFEESMSKEFPVRDESDIAKRVKTLRFNLDCFREILDEKEEDARQFNLLRAEYSNMSRKSQLMYSMLQDAMIAQNRQAERVRWEQDVELKKLRAELESRDKKIDSMKKIHEATIRDYEYKLCQRLTKDADDAMNSRLSLGPVGSYTPNRVPTVSEVQSFGASAGFSNSLSVRVASSSDDDESNSPPFAKVSRVSGPGSRKRNGNF